jgi:hypothetical protein
MNNILINWKYIRKGVPKGRKSAIDRIPESTEIKKLLHASDIRLKPIVYFMLSSGIRVGAWQELRWKNVTPLKDKIGNLIAAKLLVYPFQTHYFVSCNCLLTEVLVYHNYAPDKIQMIQTFLLT